jgi:23S rRNA (adenine2503-C2)-methyltransferase
VDLLSLTRDELTSKLEELGEPRFRGAQLCSWIYERRAKTFEEMTDLPRAFRMALSKRFALRPLTKVKGTGSKDSTRKLLFRLADGQMIETVLIPASPRFTENEPIAAQFVSRAKLAAFMDGSFAPAGSMDSNAI